MSKLKSGVLGTSGRFSLGTSSRTGDEEVKDLCLVLMVAQPSASVADAPTRVPACFACTSSSPSAKCLSRQCTCSHSNLLLLSVGVSAAMYPLSLAFSSMF